MSFWDAPEASQQHGSKTRADPAGGKLKRALKLFFGATNVSVYEVAGEAHVPFHEISGEAAAARQRAAKGKGKVGEEPHCPSLAHASGDSAWSMDQQRPWSPDGQQQEQQQQQATRLGRLACSAAAAMLSAGTPSLEEALDRMSAPAAAPAPPAAGAAAGRSVELSCMSPWASGSTSGPGSTSTSGPGGSGGSAADAWASAAGGSGSGSWQASAGPSRSSSWDDSAGSSGSGGRYSDQV